MFRKNSYWDDLWEPRVPFRPVPYAKDPLPSRTAAKEDAIHALRRIEHEIRGGNFDPQQVADDLDAAISQVIDI